MSAFVGSKLDTELVGKAVSALLKYEAKKGKEGSGGKSLLMSNYSKPILVQVCFTFEYDDTKSNIIRCDMMCKMC